MPRLLRTVRTNRWIKDEAQPFLAQDDVPADTVLDLNTSDNLLSVWELLEDRSNLERVVRAVALGRNHIDNAGYVIFDSKILEQAGIEMIKNSGGTDDQEANAWHWDLSLSGNKLVALVKGILVHDGTENGTILKKRMKELIVQGVQQGHLPADVQKKFEKN
jgi:hypothetical protein